MTNGKSQKGQIMDHSTQKTKESATRSTSGTRHVTVEMTGISPDMEIMVDT
jgi:hypothetical protein